MFDLMEFINSFTTTKETSASKRAILISRNVTSRSVSDITALPEYFEQFFQILCSVYQT